MMDVYKMLYTLNFTKITNVINELEKARPDFGSESLAYEVITSAIIELKGIQTLSDEYLVEFGDGQPDESDIEDTEEQPEDSLPSEDDNGGSVVERPDE